MGAAELIFLTIVLLLALYGCAKLITTAVRCMVRPARPQLCLMLTLQSNTEDAEHQLYFARWLSKEMGIPFCVDMHDPGDEMKQIVMRFTKDSEAEKIVDGSCIDKF